MLLRAFKQQAAVVASSLSVGIAGPGEVEGHACAVIQIEQTGKMRCASSSCLGAKLALGSLAVWCSQSITREHLLVAHR